MTDPFSLPLGQTVANYVAAASQNGSSGRLTHEASFQSFYRQATDQGPQEMPVPFSTDSAVVRPSSTTVAGTAESWRQYQSILNDSLQSLRPEAGPLELLRQHLEQNYQQSEALPRQERRENSGRLEERASRSSPEAQNASIDRSAEMRARQQREQQQRIEHEQAEEARRQVERTQAERIKAERIKAERIKAEQAKAEQVKAEQAKAEQAKAEQTEGTVREVNATALSEIQQDQNTAAKPEEQGLAAASSPEHPGSRKTGHSGEPGQPANQQPMLREKADQTKSGQGTLSPRHSTDKKLSQAYTAEQAVKKASRPAPQDAAARDTAVWKSASAGELKAGQSGKVQVLDQRNFGADLKDSKPVGTKTAAEAAAKAQGGSAARKALQQPQVAQSFPGAVSSRMAKQGKEHADAAVKTDASESFKGSVGPDQLANLENPVTLQAQKQLALLAKSAGKQSNEKQSNEKQSNKAAPAKHSEAGSDLPLNGAKQAQNKSVPSRALRKSKGMQYAPESTNSKQGPAQAASGSVGSEPGRTQASPAGSAGESDSSAAQFPGSTGTNGASSPGNPGVPLRSLAWQLAQRLQEGPLAQNLRQLRFRLLDQNRGEIRLRLNPDNLGQLRIHLSMDGNQLSGHIVADRAEAARILQNNMQQLEASLREGGFDNQGLNVSVSGGQAGDAQSSRRESERNSGRTQGTERQDGSAAWEEWNADELNLQVEQSQINYSV